MSENASNQQMHLLRLRGMSQAKAFLGREFLSWLWYQAENSSQGMIVETDSASYQVEIWIDDKIVLESTSGTSHSHTIKGGDPAQSSEAAASLLNGKTPRELKLGLNIGSWGDFSFVLKAEDIQPRSIQLPEESEQAEENNSHSVIHSRIDALQVLCSVLDGLFSSFMDERTDETRHNSFKTNMKEWIRGRPAKSDSLLH